MILANIMAKFLLKFFKKQPKKQVIILLKSILLLSDLRELCSEDKEQNLNLMSKNRNPDFLTRSQILSTGDNLLEILILLALSAIDEF